MEISVNKKYKEPGFKAYNILDKYNDKVKITGKVNTKKLGTYTLKYSYKLFFIHATKIRTIKVVDKEAPKITLEEDIEEICKNKSLLFA